MRVTFNTSVWKALAIYWMIWCDVMANGGVSSSRDGIWRKGLDGCVWFGCGMGEVG